MNPIQTIGIVSTQVATNETKRTPIQYSLVNGKFIHPPFAKPYTGHRLSFFVPLVGSVDIKYIVIFRLFVPFCID